MPVAPDAPTHALSNDAGGDATLAQAMDDVEGSAIGQALALLLGQDDEHARTIDAGRVQRRRVIEAAFRVER